jgi:hypothetical protein
MMCFSRPKSRIRVDDLMDGLILQIMTTIERKSSARAKAAREGLAIIRLFGLLSLRPRCFLSALSHHRIVFGRAAPRRCISRQAAYPRRHVRDPLAGRSITHAG